MRLNGLRFTVLAILVGLTGLLLIYSCGNDITEELIAPPCHVAPSSLNFGAVKVDQYRDLIFSITNAGSLSTEANIEMADSGCFSVRRGGGKQEIEPDAVHVVTVRFAPTSADTFENAVLIGGGCAKVPCLGVGRIEIPPECDLEPSSLAFRVEDIGGSQSKTFTLTNAGGGTLTDDVTELCGEFSVAPGTYSLGEGQSETFTVTYSPEDFGDDTCSVDLGTCGSVICTATGPKPPECQVDPTSLSFSVGEVGGSQSRSFTVTNIGGGTLTGSLTEMCGEFEVTPDAYSLGAGESSIFTVTYTPEDFGDDNCIIELGACGGVTCEAEGPVAPGCAVDPTSLSFSVEDVGEGQSRTFTVTNTGGGTLSGDVLETCDDFTVTPGSYNLDGGQTETFTVTYTPADCGDDYCTIDLGGCGNVTCTAAGPETPICDVNPTGLDFSVADPGGSDSKTFVITNTGCGILAGDVTETCDEFSVTPESYSLGAGQSETFTVTYSPADCGDDTCDIDLGDCGTVGCTAAGPAAPQCDVSPTGLTFVVDDVGGSDTGTFAITNAGCGTLSGSVAEACDEFTVSPASYSLAQGQSDTFTVTYSPDDFGDDTCTVDLGTCGSLSCTATGPRPPGCGVDPSSLTFDVPEVGGSQAQTFTITNEGGGILSGSVSESCSEFSVTPLSYSLGAGQFETFTVTYSPADFGDDNCTIDLGTCGSLACTAAGPSAPNCGLDPSSLSFDVAYVGSSQTRDFTITNTGGGTLSGSVTESCPEFAVTPGSYSLGADESETFTVTYSPADCGDDNCTISLGGCGSISCTASGPSTPTCEVTPDTLTFNVGAGGNQYKTFTITHSGCGTLSGSVREYCGEFTVTPDSYNLTDGDSETFIVVYAPDDCGNDECTIDLGPCGSVLCLATGPSKPVCKFTPDTLTFGEIAVGESLETSFTVNNTGCGPAIGDVTETCAEFRVVPGSFSIPRGGSETFSVTYKPEDCGADTCTLDLGPCGTIPCFALGPNTPECDLSTDSLGFSVGLIGGNQNRTFTLTNAACGTLAGTVTESCAEFSVSPGSYSLSGGQSQIFTVTYSPVDCGDDACTIDLGGCGSVACTATGPVMPLCDVSPRDLGFSVADVGSNQALTFTVTNINCGTLSGTVTESCAEFSVTPGSYSLTNGQSEVFTVTYAPADCGDDTCLIDLGACDSVLCIAAGPGTPECELSADTLSFSVPAVGGNQGRTFTITNTKCGTLSGTVTETCDDFTVSPGSYSLTGGESEVFTVTYAPAGCGDDTCLIDLGGCGTLACIAAGPTTPECGVSADTLSFSVPAVGGSQDRTFSINNSGCGTLAGTVTEACGDFSVSPGSYSLTGGQSEIFTVTYAPGDCGNDDCTIDLGTCGSVFCTASGPADPECEVYPESFDFGIVPVGQAVDTTFIIKNIACGILSGTVSSPCGDYVIVGTPTYGILPGDSAAFTVRFQPSTDGAIPCTIETGNARCGDISATGQGCIEGCGTAPDTLDFGEVYIGCSRTDSLTVTNTGTCVLSGNIAGPASTHYSIVSGSGPFSLAAGEDRVVTVEFAPTAAGTQTYSIATGADSCPALECTGVASQVTCDVSADSLDFGSIAVGSNSTLVFTITNNGTADIAVNLSESCAEFSITGEGSQIIPGSGGTLFVNVTFEPVSVGTKTCTISLGACLCPVVECRGTAF